MAEWKLDLLKRLKQCFHCFWFLQFLLSASHTPLLPKFKFLFCGKTIALSLYCCTQSLTNIYSSNVFVPPHHSTGWLIIHFIIPPTTCTLLQTQKIPTMWWTSMQVFAQVHSTPKQKPHIIFQLHLKLLQTTHHALQWPTGGLLYQSMLHVTFLKYTQATNAVPSTKSL